MEREVFTITKQYSLRYGLVKHSGGVLEKLVILLSLDGSKQVIISWQMVCPEEVLLFSSFVDSFLHPSLQTCNGRILSFLGSKVILQ
jgi:hypothetical protein